jgi:predicted RNase H-like nuclease (RuvC/YqgF family)
MKTLEHLIENALVQIRELEKENAMLKKQVQSHELEMEKYLKEIERVRKSEEFRKNLKKKLLRLCLKIDKAINSNSPRKDMVVKELEKYE